MSGQVANLAKKIMQAETRFRIVSPARKHWLLPVVVSVTVCALVLWLTSDIVIMSCDRPPFEPQIVFWSEWCDMTFRHTRGGGMFRWPRTNREVIWSPGSVDDDYIFMLEVPYGTSLDNIADRNIDSTSVINARGVGGGRAGAYGSRPSNPQTSSWLGRKRRISPVIKAAVDAALDWLARHQDKDGKWDQDGFDKNCEVKEEKERCTGQGTSQYDVGVTSLALLAFLGAGHDHRVGPFRKTVKKGLKWLQGQQQEDGSFGSRDAESWVYNTAIAAFALCEAYRLTEDYRLKKTCRKAVDFILKAQNPGLGWDYEPQSGHNNTSVTGWMIMALRAAKGAGLKVEQSAFDGAVNWFDRVTDTKGEAGYMKPGDKGRTVKGVKDSFEKLPAMTALAVISRIFCGQKRQDAKVLKGVDILMNNLPDWNRSSNTKVDMYYWFWGTRAMYQYGGQKWHKWSTAVKNALVGNQQAGGCTHGSWDPVGKWGMVGGRVYSTAINCMTLEISYHNTRHLHLPRVIGEHEKRKK